MVTRPSWQIKEPCFPILTMAILTVWASSWTACSGSRSVRALASVSLAKRMSILGRMFWKVSLCFLTTPASERSKETKVLYFFAKSMAYRAVSFVEAPK